MTAKVPPANDANSPGADAQPYDDGQRKSVSDRNDALVTQEKMMELAQDKSKPSIAFNYPHRLTNLVPDWGRSGGLTASEPNNVLLSLIALDMVDYWRFDKWTGQIVHADRPATEEEIFDNLKYGASVFVGKPVDFDVEIANVRLAIARDIRYSPTKEAVADALETAARAYYFNAIRDWFNALPEWDQVNRLYRLSSYFNAANSELVNETLALLPRAVYARATSDEFVHFDYCPILYSPTQGYNKSRALRLLAVREEFHQEEYPKMLKGSDISKKLQENVMGKTVVEFAEFNNLGGEAMATLKSAITQRQFSNRLAYKRSNTTQITRHVYAGTTNKMDILSDTRNRRFPIVECGEILLDLLTEDIPQIYAEVKARHVAGDTEIALPQHLWAEALDATELHRDVHPFELWALEWLYDKSEVDCKALDDAYKAEPNSTPCRLNVQAEIMDKLGYTKAKRTRPPRVRYWVKKEMVMDV